MAIETFLLSVDCFNLTFFIISVIVFKLIYSYRLLLCFFRVRVVADHGEYLSLFMFGADEAKVCQL